jgi:hypothetical protein
MSSPQVEQPEVQAVAITPGLVGHATPRVHHATPAVNNGLHASCSRDVERPGEVSPGRCASSVGEGGTISLAWSGSLWFGF